MSSSPYKKGEKSPIPTLPAPPEPQSLGAVKRTRKRRGMKRAMSPERILQRRKWAAEYEKTRPSSYRRGYDKRWRALRLKILSETPECTQCVRNAATVIDHIIPHKGDQTLFWARENLQPLCKFCHDMKTSRGE